MTVEFKPFPKIPRLNREIIVTEKLDGTNAIIHVDGDSIQAGSRKRWITPSDDNFGFAKWVEQNKEELLTLGDGYHYGEWYGKGIQRGYGLEDKRFALFNSTRWTDDVRPSCCEVVTVLGTSNVMNVEFISDLIDDLKYKGSVHVPGYMQPEGVVVYHTASQSVFKVLCENDEGCKG